MMSTCHGAILTAFILVFVTLIVIGFPVLVGISVLQNSRLRQKEQVSKQLPISVCDPGFQASCIPDACSNITCHLLLDAICISDRCGCEAHFFLWDKKQQAYQNITVQCLAFNILVRKFLDNFLNRIWNNLQIIISKTILKCRSKT